MSFSLKNGLTAPGKRLVKQQLMFATLVTLVSVLVTYFIWELNYAYSALLGGVIVIIPNVIFGRKAFKYAGATKSQQVIDEFYQGEKLKILITVVLFALVFRFLPIVPVPLFSVFCLVMILSLLTPVLFKL